MKLKLWRGYATVPNWWILLHEGKWGGIHEDTIIPWLCELLKRKQ